MSAAAGLLFKGASYFAKSAAVLLTPPLTNTLVARLGNPGLT